MKTNLILPTLLIISSCFVGELPPDMDNRIQFYYDGEDTVQLTLFPGKYFLVIESETDRDELSELLFLPLRQVGTVQSKSVSGYDEAYDFHWVSITDAGPDVDWGNEIIRYRAPYYFTTTSVELGLTHLFTATLVEDENFSALEELAEENGVVLLGESEAQPGQFLLRCSSSSKGNALEMANLFKESTFVDRSRPMFMDQQELQ